MDNPLTPKQQDLAIEDALHSYPLASMPRDLTAQVLTRIQSVPPPRSFRLTWSDFALGLVLFLCVGAVWFGLQHLPPLVIAHLRKESILFYQHILVNARWLIPVVSFGMAGFLAALTLPYLGQELRKSLHH